MKIEKQYKDIEENLERLFEEFQNLINIQIEYKNNDKKFMDLKDIRKKRLEFVENCDYVSSDKLFNELLEQMDFKLQNSQYLKDAIMAHTDSLKLFVSIKKTAPRG
jgi:hypothetical protein